MMCQFYHFPVTQRVAYCIISSSAPAGHSRPHGEKTIYLLHRGGGGGGGGGGGQEDKTTCVPVRQNTGGWVRGRGGEVGGGAKGCTLGRYAE